MVDNQIKEQSEPVCIYIGTDRSQFLAVKVLEHSIKRHTQLPVVVCPMLNLPIQVPKDPQNWQRTGFSFSRFCIPELAGYRGKALYLDADMLVFQDIAFLWDIPFDGAKIVIQEELQTARQKNHHKFGAPSKRIKQCAVMLLDCSTLDWHIDNIIRALDNNEYDYDRLMYDLCLLAPSDIKYGVPFEWNSLEFYEAGKTSLIHYTDMATQPWISSQNTYGYLWLNELRLMLDNGSLGWDELQNEIDAGYFRPSLILDLKYCCHLPIYIRPLLSLFLQKIDQSRYFKPHREVYAIKQKRQKALKEYQAISK